jgi:hypothetical protein
MTSGKPKAFLQQIQLRAFRRRFGEADADSNQAYWLAGPAERFIEKSAEVW